MMKIAGLYHVPIENYRNNGGMNFNAMDVAYSQSDYCETEDARALKFDDEVPSRYLFVHRKFHRKLIMLNGIIQAFPKTTFPLF